MKIGTSTENKHRGEMQRHDGQWNERQRNGDNEVRENEVRDNQVTEKVSHPEPAPYLDSKENTRCIIEVYGL